MRIHTCIQCICAPLQVHIVTNKTGTEEDDYGDSHISLIGQIFFPNDIIDELHTIAPYSDWTSGITYLETDMVYTGDTSTIGNVTVDYPGHFEWGVTVTHEAIVDPTVMTDFIANSGSAAGSSATGNGPKPADVPPSGGMGGPSPSTSA